MKENQAWNAHVHKSRDYPQLRCTYYAKEIEFLNSYPSYNFLVGRGSSSALYWVWVSTFFLSFCLLPPFFATSTIYLLVNSLAIISSLTKRDY